MAAPSVHTADSVEASLDGRAAGKSAVSILRALVQGPDRLSQDRLELLVKELQAKGTTTAGAIAVQLSMWGKLVPALRELAQNHVSHHVATRAVTALLRLGKMEDLRDLAMSPDTGLSAARQGALLRSLARCGPKLVAGVITRDFIKEVHSRHGHNLAARLLGRSTDPELVSSLWPELLKHSTSKLWDRLPLSPQLSLASRLPEVMLRLLLDPAMDKNSRSNDFNGRPPVRSVRELKRLVPSMSVSKPDLVWQMLDEAVAKSPRSFFQNGHCAMLVGILLESSPKKAMTSLQGWLKVCAESELAKTPYNGRQGEWGEALHDFAARQGSEVRAEAWRVTVDLALKMVEIGAVGADSILRGINKEATQPDQLKKDGDAQGDKVAVPDAPYSGEQLRTLFRLLLKEPIHIGGIMTSLLAGGWHTDAALDAAMQAELSVLQESKDPEVKFPELPAPSLDPWPKESKAMILRRMAKLKKPETEVAGDAPPHDYLEVLGRLPYAEVAEELLSRCNNSNARARQAVMQCMVDCASRDPSAESEALGKVMECLERRLRNEQDDVRSQIIHRLRQSIPVRSWNASHVAACKQILTFSLQAKGTSSLSLQAWSSFVEVLVANGLASMGSTQGPADSLGPVGDFGMEAVELLRSAKQFRLEDADFGAAVLRQLDGLAKKGSWKVDAAILEWATRKWLAPKVQAEVAKKEADAACNLCARWEGLRHQLACEPSATLSSLVAASFQLAQSSLGGMMAPEALFRHSLMTWPAESTSTGRNNRAGRRRAQSRRSRMQRRRQELPKPAYGPILDTQHEAIRLLADGLSKQSLLNFFAQVAARTIPLTEVPRNVSLAVEFLAHPQGQLLERSDPALHGTLVQAVCTSWGRLADEQRNGAASIFLNRTGSLKPLVTLIADWQFPMDGPLTATTSNRDQSVQNLSTRLQYRNRAQRMLLPASKAQRREALRSMLARWKELPIDSQAELLASAPSMCWCAQRCDPEILRILLPGGRTSSAKLQMLRRLVQEAHIPLHLLKAGTGQGTLVAERFTQPLLHWPRALQLAFAEQWLAPSLTQEAVRAATDRPGSLIQVQATALCLQLPHVDVSPVKGLVAHCTEVLGGTGDSAAEMALRGSAGFLLDQLMLLLPKADQPSAIADVVADQVGMGASKQAVRSLKKLLLRLSPTDAASQLRALLGKERLKVAERVAMVRLLGDFLGRTAVPVLEGVWNNGTCHRDVGGAALVQLCHPRVCCDRAMEIFASVCQSAVHNEKVLYPLQVVLQHLEKNLPTGESESKIIGTLAQICSEAGCPAGFCSLAIYTLHAWVQKLCGSAAAQTGALPQFICGPPMVPAGWVPVHPQPGAPMLDMPPFPPPGQVMPGMPPFTPAPGSGQGPIPVFPGQPMYPPVPMSFLGVSPAGVQASSPSQVAALPQVSEDRVELAKQVALAAASLFVDLVGRGANRKTWTAASSILIILSKFVLDPLTDSIRKLLAHNDASPGSKASARLAALAVSSAWEHGACDACATILMEPRETALEGLPASTKWGLQLWARSLQWSVPGQPVAALQRLPPAVASEPAFLPVILAAVSDSFTLPWNAAAMSRSSQHLPNLQLAAEELQGLKETLGSIAIVMLIAVARYAAEPMGMGWSGWRGEAMRGALSFPHAPMALQLLLLEIHIDDAPEEAVPMDQSPGTDDEDLCDSEIESG